MKKKKGRRRQPDNFQARRDNMATLLMNRLLQRLPQRDPDHPWNELTEEALETTATKAVIAADLLIQELDAYDNLMQPP
jgi:hypothetical protein